MTYQNGSEKTEQAVWKGDTLKEEDAPTPTKEGCTFLGWYKDSACTEKWNFSDAVTQDMALYAGWEDLPSGLYVTVLDSSSNPVSGVTAKLCLGQSTLATAQTDADGVCIFSPFQAGLYNLVVTTTDGQTLTQGLDLQNRTEPVISVTVTMPAANINSELVITGSATPTAVVTGLDDIAKNLGTVTEPTTVRLNIESVPFANETAFIQIQEKAADKTLSYFNISLEKLVADTSTDLGKSNNTVLEIAVDYDTTLPKIVVYRSHEDNGAVKTEAFQKLSARPASNYKDGTYFVGDGKVYIYAKLFSTYAIAHGTSVPKTGDAFPVLPCALLLVLSACVCVLAIRKKRG